MQKYAKGWASLAVTLVTLLLGVVTDGITLAEWLTVGGAFVGTIAVVGLPNLPRNPAVKAIAQAMGAVLGGLAVAIVTPEGITTTVILQLVIVVFGTLGVNQVSNVGDRYDREQSRLAA